VLPFCLVAARSTSTVQKIFVFVENELEIQTNLFGTTIEGLWKDHALVHDFQFHEGLIDYF
jgi:hypothetical protein